MQKYIQFKKMKICYKTIYFKDNNLTTLFLNGWGENFSIWEKIISSANLESSIILLDFPPFGKSDKLNTPLNLNDYINIVKKILIKEKVKNINVVCHSFGARITFELCLNFLNENSKIVIISGAGIREHKFLTKSKIIVYKLKRFLNNLGFNFSLNHGSEDYKNLNKIEKKTFSNIVMYDQKKILHKIKQKTLIICAKDDKITSYKSAKTMNKKIKNSIIYTFKSGGHFASFIQYKTSATLIKNFLNKE